MRAPPDVPTNEKLLPSGATATVRDVEEYNSTPAGRLGSGGVVGAAPPAVAPGVPHPRQPAHAARRLAAAATTQGRYAGPRDRAADVGASALPDPDTAASSSIRTSPAWRRRRATSLLRQRRTSRLTDSGVSRGSAAHSGSRVSTPAMASDTLSVAPIARRPVSISKITQPNAQMSVRSSSALPRACSGLMYAAVPRMKPAWVIAGDIMVGDIVSAAAPDPPEPVGSASFARPKSSTFTLPSGC